VSQVPFILTPLPPDEPVAPAISRQDEKYKTDVTRDAQDEIGYRQPCIENLAGGEIKRKRQEKKILRPFLVSSCGSAHNRILKSGL